MRSRFLVAGKKGMTLVELMVAVIMVAVVMLLAGRFVVGLIHQVSLSESHTQANELAMEELERIRVLDPDSITQVSAQSLPYAPTLQTSFTAENWGSGPTAAEMCETTVWGRGCLYLTGGVIQQTRGAVGRVTGHGYLKRYAYDSNARFCPPPHFSTTGKYLRNRYYQVNSEAFQDKSTFFAELK